MPAAVARKLDRQKNSVTRSLEGGHMNYESRLRETFGATACAVSAHAHSADFGRCGRGQQQLLGQHGRFLQLQQLEHLLSCGSANN
eukprot:1474510-Amphidinium_carterae.2